ncbi:energy transducer TonB [Rhizobium sp. Root483D2]|uniref:energy transducer TonB n=1 Tax=Rhizobium sp. Root483D2 TaxID=1736545 RepID=UPI000712E4DC|nr:energy transducer TonB [Rhizobium sp. Root483D2]KQY44211.1 energy transducer TonB [Rhizobium sp. Root483D2]
MNTILKWTGAILLSLLAHAGATQLFEPNEEPQELALVAGGEAMEVAVLGNAFEETVLSGDPTEAIEPEEAEPEEIVPEPTEVAEVSPVQSEVTAETPSDIVPAEADVILPAEEIVEAVTAQPEITATVAPIETVVPQEKPDIKPEPEKKAEPKKEPEKEKPKKKVVKKRAGDAGKQVETAVKGQADGAEGAAATASTGKKGKVAQAFGNAAESNYKGKVRSRVQRYFRFPRSADRAGLGGTVTVSFTVSTGGGVSGVRIVKGSGSPVLDEAAINAVRKAEPFPKIPEAANRTSWLFTIPLQFAR